MMAIRLWVMGSMLAASLLTWGCSPASPSPAPTTAAPAATEATTPSQATAAPAKAAAPTALPTKAAAYPTKGRAVTILVPYAAGGNVDLSARLVAPAIEKELGTPIEIVNKPGAASQVAATELAKAKPDGHTLMWVSLTALISTYLDPEKQAVYHRKEFIPVAQSHWAPICIAVRPDSQYKTVEDLIAVAKAKPDTVKVGTSGLLGTPHMTIVLLDSASGGRFAPVHFEGGQPAMAALLGGHIDAQFEGSGQFMGPVKSGQLRLLGVFGNQPSAAFPGVPTMESKGYKIYMGLSLGLVAPAGTSAEAVALLSSAIKKATEPKEFATKSLDMGLDTVYLDSDRYAAFWNELEESVARVIKKERGQVREK